MFQSLRDLRGFVSRTVTNIETIRSFLVYFIQYYAGNQGLVERPPKRSRPSLYMDHVNMAYVVQRIRKGYFSLDQGRASKTLD